MTEHFELLIRGGTLVDGSGAPGRLGEVGIRTVIVNGVVLRENDKDRLGPNDSLPGRVLRGGHAR